MVTAMIWVQTLAWEFLHAVGVAKKNERYDFSEFFFQHHFNYAHSFGSQYTYLRLSLPMPRKKFSWDFD